MNSTKSHTVCIEKLIFKGWGLAKLDKWTVFVPKTFPGEEVEIDIVQKKKNHLIGKKLRTIKPSPFESTSPCKHASECGGCQMIQVPYDQQLQLKKMILEDCFYEHPNSPLDQLKPIIPAHSNRFYRNKMEFAFATHHNEVILGLKKQGQFDAVVQTSACQLQSEKSNDIRHRVETLIQATPLTSWDPHTHTGHLRYLIVRESKARGTVLINFVCSEDLTQTLSPIAQQLQSEFPEICSVYMSIQDQKSDTAYTGRAIPLTGQLFLEESLENFSFKISPYAFFQTNTKGAETLYKTIRKLANLSKNDMLLDLYCGTGTIGLFLAQDAGEVIGIEENPSAIQDAKDNAHTNHITNIRFIEGRVKNILKFNTFSPTAIVVDPPRSGMVPKALRRTLDLAADKLIYVSCNPTTFARDLSVICEANYKIETLQPVDMFPNTFHLETICVFRRSD